LSSAIYCRRKLHHIILDTYNELRPELLSRHGNMAIAVDIMYINSIPFFMTVSRNLHFCIAELIINEKNVTIMQALRQVIEHIMQEVLKKTYIRSWAIRAQEKTH